MRVPRAGWSKIKEQFEQMHRDHEALHADLNLPMLGDIFKPKPSLDQQLGEKKLIVQPDSLIDVSPSLPVLPNHKVTKEQMAEIEKLREQINFAIDNHKFAHTSEDVRKVNEVDEYSFDPFAFLTRRRQRPLTPKSQISDLWRALFGINLQLSRPSAPDFLKPKKINGKSDDSGGVLGSARRIVSNDDEQIPAADAFAKIKAAVAGKASENLDDAEVSMSRNEGIPGAELISEVTNPLLNRGSLGLGSPLGGANLLPNIPLINEAEEAILGQAKRIPGGDLISKAAEGISSGNPMAVLEEAKGMFTSSHFVPLID